MRRPLLILALGIASSTASAAGRGSAMNFSAAHSGLILGAGTYFHVLRHDNAFDPVPALAPSGTTLSGTNNYYLLPIKIGFFREVQGRSFLEVYGRYMLNTKSAWRATGDIPGTGTTTFKSLGGGFNAGSSLLTYRLFRIQLVFNGEYVMQKAKVSFHSDAYGNEDLNLASNSVLMGLGLRPELWLADTWVLSVFGGYQYGLTRYWSAAKAASIFGSAQSGEIQNPTTGDRSIAQFGGFLTEACLKLNF